jgi:hypothetical protein
VDVTLATGIFYLMTTIIIGRRPRLKLSDALIFGLSFLSILLTPYGRAFYSGFSVAHNYLLIIIITLLFTLPYIRDIFSKKRVESRIFPLAMLVAGFIFGLSSNLTPIVFLLAIIVNSLFNKLYYKKATNIMGFVKSWKFFGITGTLIGLSVMYILGPGLSGYITSSNAIQYDYISISQIIDSPAVSIVSLMKHLFVNFGLILIPLGFMALMIWATYYLLRKNKPLKVYRFTNSEYRFLIIGTFFIIIHVLIVSQVGFPIRIMLPAYICGVIMTLFAANRLIGHAYVEQHVKNRCLLILCGIVIVGIISVTLTRLVLAVNYYYQVTPIFQEIQDSNESTICVLEESVRSKAIPIIYLGQEDMLASWAMPEIIYGKEVIFCND